MIAKEKDLIRAEAAMLVLASMYQNHIPREPPRNESPEQEAARVREDAIRRMSRALEACNAADALLAELLVREESKPDPLTAKLQEMYPDGIPPGANILSCKHGKASFEPCEDCDREHAAAEESARIAAEPNAGKDGQGGENRQN